MIKFICDGCNKEIKEKKVIEYIEKNMLPNYEIVKDKYKLYCKKCRKNILGE